MLAVLIGLALCLGVPLLSFLAGVLYARHGAPVAVAWRWRRRPADSFVLADEE